MRKPFALALIFTMVFSGLYVFNEVQAVCDAPLSYRIGTLDERFGLTHEQARLAIADAESVWEQATGRNLFTYDPEAKFPINFIFDERQEFALAEEEFRQRLDASEGVNSAIGETYEILIARYERLEEEYKAKVDSYERRLAAYNKTVEEYNEDGGAPQAAFAELQIERDKLNSELSTVNRLGEQLNALGDEINTVSQQGNQLIESFNRNVERYNSTFGSFHEFTQGDYRGTEINIYKFIDSTELQLVLVHELGHALWLDHVDGEDSIMHSYLGGQASDLRLSEQDLSEFERVCGQTTRSFIERLFIRFGIY